MNLSHKEIVGLYIIHQNMQNVDLDLSMLIFFKKIEEYILNTLSVGEIQNIREYYNRIEV